MALAQDWGYGSFSINIWKAKKKCSQSIETILRAVVAKGDSIQRMITLIRGIHEASKKDATRLVRTDMIY